MSHWDRLHIDDGVRYAEVLFGREAQEDLGVRTMFHMTIEYALRNAEREGVNIHDAQAFVLCDKIGEW